MCEDNFPFAFLVKILYRQILLDIYNEDHHYHNFNLRSLLLKSDVIGDTVLRALPLKIQKELMEKGYTMLMPMLNIVLWLKPN